MALIRTIEHAEAGDEQAGQLVRAVVQGVGGQAPLDAVIKVARFIVDMRKDQEHDQ